MHNWKVVAALVAVACVAAPGAADAAVVSYCVPSTSIPNCPQGGTSQPTIAAALSASGAVAGHHAAIYLGPQTYNENDLFDHNNVDVDIIGDGPSKTAIAPSTAASSSVVLSLEESLSTVTKLTIVVPSGSNNTGLFLGSAHASAITVTSAPGATTATGVSEANGFLTTSRISMAGDGTGVSVGIGTVRQTTIAAGTGIAGGGNLARDRITATIGVNATALNANSEPTIDDSLIRTVPGTGTETAISAVSEGGGGEAEVSARHDTLIGDGSSSSVGVSCDAAASSGPADCEANIDSTIIRSFRYAVSREAVAFATNATANVSLDYSDFDPAADFSSNVTNGTGVGSGSITRGSHNLNVKPLFASTTAAAPLAFRLSTRSPVIDMGDPALGGGEPLTDLDGAPRVVAGRVRKSVRSDMGAFEYQPKPPVVSARAPRTTVRPRTPVPFTANVTLMNTGDAVKAVRWSFDDGTTAAGLRVTHAFLKPGRHKGTATVTDLNGYSVSSSASVTVPGKPTASGSLSGLAKGQPKLHVTLTHGANAPAVKSVSVGLPGGLGYSHHWFVSHTRCRGTGKQRTCTTTVTAKGLSVAGGSVRSVRLSGGRLVLSLHRPANSLSITASGPLLAESAALQTNVQKRKVKFATVSLKITDANSTSTATALKLNLR